MMALVRELFQAKFQHQLQLELEVNLLDWNLNYAI
jgi:hypothetical protein